MALKTPSESGQQLWELFSHDQIIQLLGDNPTKTTSNYNKLAVYVESRRELDGTPFAERASIFRKDYQTYNKLRRQSKSGKIRSTSVDHSLKDANKFLQDNFAQLTPEFVLNELRKDEPQMTMPKNTSKMILKYIVNKPSIGSSEMIQQASTHLKNLQGYSLEEHHNFLKTLPQVSLQTAIDYHQDPKNNHCNCLLHPKIGHHFSSASYWNAHVLLEYHAKHLKNEAALHRFNKLLSQHHYRNRIEETATTTSLIQTVFQPHPPTSTTTTTTTTNQPVTFPVEPKNVQSNISDDVEFIKQFNLNMEQVKDFIDNLRRLCNEHPLTSDIRTAAYDDRERVLSCLKFLSKCQKNSEAKQRYKRIQEQLLLEEAITSGIGHKAPELTSIESVSTEEAVAWFNSCVQRKQKSLINGCAFRMIEHPLKRGNDLDLKVRYNYVINLPCPSDPELKKAHLQRVELAKKGLHDKLNKKSENEKQRQAKRQKFN